MALFGLTFADLIECQENIESITKSGNNLAFVDHHGSPDINFNGQCLICNTHIPKKGINIYISYTHASHQFWKVLESPGILLKFWKSHGIFLWSNSPKERFLSKH